MRAMARGLRYERLVTERANRASAHLDRLDARGIAALMNREDARVVRAVARVARDIAGAVNLIVAALRSGGRLGVLEAAECPPTFGTPPSLVQGIMAGGRAAVFRSREGAEDDARAGAQAIRARARAGDVVVGVSASGVTPFVRGALTAARRIGAKTVLVTCNKRVAARPSGAGGPAKAPRRQIVDVTIAPDPGPEVLAGSTRLKAGTATKLVLNTLTTASMARVGKVYGNRMVDVQPRSRKLRARAARLVAELGDVSPARARQLLAAANGRVPGAPAPALRCRRRGAPSGGVPATRPRAERCAPSRDAPLTVGICGGERAWLRFRARRRIGHRDCSLPRTCYCSVAPGIRDITAIHACSASRRGVDFVCNSLTESAPGVQAVSWMTTR